MSQQAADLALEHLFTFHPDLWEEYIKLYEQYREALNDPDTAILSCLIEIVSIQKEQNWRDMLGNQGAHLDRPED